MIITIPFIHTNNQWLAEKEFERESMMQRESEKELEQTGFDTEVEEKVLVDADMEEKVKTIIANNEVDSSTTASGIEIASTIARDDFDVYKKTLEECEN